MQYVRSVARNVPRVIEYERRLTAFVLPGLQLTRLRHLGNLTCTHICLVIFASEYKYEKIASKNLIRTVTTRSAIYIKLYE